MISLAYSVRQPDVTITVSINSKSCTTFTTCSKCPPFAATQAPGASLQGEDPDCGGVAAAHYGRVGTPRPAWHRQRSEVPPCLCHYKRRTFLTSCMQCRRGLAMRKLSVRPSVRLSVCLSVCLSVKRVNCDKTEERSVKIFIPNERSFRPVFLEEKWLVGASHSTWNFGSTGPRWSEIADFEPIFARSASAVTPTEKSSINTNRKCTMRFPMSLRWSSYVTTGSPKGGGGLKNAKRPIFVQNRTSLEESLLQSFFVWKLSDAKL